MQEKLVTSTLLKITVFWKKVYDETISVYDVTSRIVSRDLNYIVDVVIWLTLGNYSIYMQEFIKTSIF